jgi:hypothetical protein
MSKNKSSSLPKESKMKRKLDFVTNSSSSSFIVAWPERVSLYEQVKDIVLFTEKADIVYKDCMNQKPFLIANTASCINKITKKVVSGYFDGYCSCSDFPEYRELYERRCRKDITETTYRKEMDKLFKKVEKENRKRAKMIAERFIKNNLGKYAYIFHYSDNDSRLFSELVHGSTFDRLDNITISHH